MSLEVLTPMMELPEDVEIVRVNGRWWLLLVTDAHMAATADPEKWIGLKLDEAQLAPWEAPSRDVRRFVEDLGAQKADVNA